MLNDAYLVSQIIAAIAVVSSLVVLIVSIRQNTRVQRTASVESLTAAIAAINVPAMESPKLGQALSQVCVDWGAASREERIVAHYFLFSFFKLCEQAWYQHRSGALDDDQWAGWEFSLLRLHHSPGVAAGWWPHRRAAYSAAFQRFLAASAPPHAPAGAQYDLFEDPRRKEPEPPDAPAAA